MDWRASKLAFVSWVLFIPLFAQPQGFSPNTLISRSSITQYTGDYGLISNNINSAIQARSGFIWITTYNGIMRFDGRRVDVFDRANIPFLATDAFYKVYEDFEGTLWFASQGSGIIAYKNNKFTKVDSTDQVLPKSVRCLLLEKDGSAWAGTNNNGLYFLKDNKPAHIDFKELNQVGILDLIKDSNGVLWIATDGQGLYGFDGKELHAVDGLLSKTVNALQVTKDNTLVIATTGGLNLLRNGKLAKYDSLKNYQTNCLAIDRFNRIWVGAELGLARIGLDDASFEFITEKEGYPLARINTLAFDRENSLWISTGRNGLVQMRESSVVNFTTSDGLSNNKVNVILEGPDQKFYIGSDAGAVDVYSRGSVKSFPIKMISPDAGIRDILIDRNGSFWIASYKGLLKVDHGHERLFTEKDGLPAIDLRRVIQDKQGNIWVASRSFGIARINADAVTRLYNKTNGLNSNYILALEEDENGNIYVGTHSGGLSIINSKGELKNFNIAKDDAGILIFNIHIDEQGKIWVVSNIGLMYFDGAKFIPLNIQRIIKGETYFDWVEDTMGNVWITTNIGVFRMKKSEVLDAVAGKIKIIATKLFDNLDGMRAKECTGATHSILSSTGKIWIPTIGGVSVFYPDKIKINPTPPPVYVTSLMADNKEELGSSEIEIAPGKLRYIFHYTALSFISPAKNHFRYKLEGVDDDWIDAGVDRQAEYTNLRPGSYTFTVHASNSDGVWNEQGASVRFSVRPFFYQTIWFYLIGALSLALLLYLIYKWRIMVIERSNAELRKLNNELDRFVYSASHDLRAPLASILGLINVARLDDSSRVDDYLKKIEISVNKLDGFIRDIIDFSRNARTEIEVEPIEFEKLIHEIIDNLMYLDEKNQIKRIVNVNATGSFYTDRKRLTIVLNNLISNAVKYFNPHSQNPFIEVDVEMNDRAAKIIVKDNGIGIAAVHLDNIFKMFYRGDEKSRGSGLGLYIVKETVDKIGGTISVNSKYGEGSSFTVTLPSLPDAKHRKAEIAKEAQHKPAGEVVKSDK